MEIRREWKLPKIMKIRWEIKILIGILLVLMTIFLLRGDSKTYLAWYLAVWVLGCGFMPLTGTLFSGYQDRGWMFSKVLAIGISGYLTWLLVTLGILKFTAASCLGVTFVCVAGNGLLAFCLDKKKRYDFLTIRGI